MRPLRRARQAQSLKKLWVILPLTAMNLFLVFTATNSVPASLAGSQITAITANDVKPTACDALDLVTVLGGPLLVTGTGADELVLGSELGDSLDGAGGSDCIIGGPGADTLNGGSGTDICLGGDGTDTFLGCETAVQ